MSYPLYAPTDNIPDTHWALHRPEAKDANFVILLQSNDVRVAVILNPTDSRGYRSIVHIVADVMKSTLNRLATIPEKQALFTVLALMAHVYESTGLIALCSPFR